MVYPTRVSVGDSMLTVVMQSHKGKHCTFGLLMKNLDRSNLQIRRIKSFLTEPRGAGQRVETFCLTSYLYLTVLYYVLN